MSTKKTPATIKAAWINAIAGGIILAIGTILGALVGPIVEKKVNQPESAPNRTPLAIEQIPGKTLTYEGEENNLSGKANLRLQIGENYPAYILVYELQSGQDGYAGLVFEFNNGVNISEYKSIDFVIKFDGPNQEVRLYLEDISGEQSFERIVSISDNDMRVSYPLGNFTNTNINALKTVKFDVNAQFGNGFHEIIVENIHFNP